MTTEIPLTQGRVALVDDADAESILGYKWYAYRTGRRNVYAGRAMAGRRLPMHTFLTGFAETDHINGNGLDNRRENLREVTRSQNGANRRPTGKSGYKGVYKRKGYDRWRAMITVNYRRLHLGWFGTAEEAARAYDAAALTHFGEYARVNLPT